MLLIVAPELVAAGTGMPVQQSLTGGRSVPPLH